MSCGQALPCQATTGLHLHIALSLHLEAVKHWNAWSPSSLSWRTFDDVHTLLLD